jgi:hemimethylated DNA binding protein
MWSLLALAAPDEAPKYSVQLMTGALNPSPKGVVVDQGHPPPNSVVMTKRGGKRYRCHLPADPNATAATEVTEEASVPHVSTYLSTLRGSCFYRLEGWWTYEFCFMKSLRQFHQEKGKGAKASGNAEEATITQEYTLGAYWLPPGHALTAESATDDEADEPQGTVSDDDFRGEMLEDPKTKRKYWRQLYGNGTSCDVTGAPRETEVRVFCAPGDPSHLASVAETSTCRYTLEFNTNLLCKHPSYVVDKKKETTESIRCEPLDADGVPLPSPKRGEAALLQQQQGGAAAAAEAEAALKTPQPGEVAYDAGQCLVHRRYNYRGVIIGADPSCKQTEAWIRQMNVDSLEHGRNQPFYHVLPDTRDRPGAQVMYVAQENVVPDTPSEPLLHPLINEMFSDFDVARGRFNPSPELAEPQ